MNLIDNMGDCDLIAEFGPLLSGLLVGKKFELTPSMERKTKGVQNQKAKLLRHCIRDHPSITAETVVALINWFESIGLMPEFLNTTASEIQCGMVELVKQKLGKTVETLRFVDDFGVDVSLKSKLNKRIRSCNKDEEKKKKALIV